MHPTGMHTNGPTLVTLEASHLNRLLQRWKLDVVNKPEDHNAI
jgi:hypothetical protein